MSTSNVDRGLPPDSAGTGRFSQVAFTPDRGVVLRFLSAACDVQGVPGPIFSKQLSATISYWLIPYFFKINGAFCSALALSRTIFSPLSVMIMW